MAAITTRMVRSSLLEIESQDFLRTARCKGLSEAAVMWRHSLPNALLPVITVLGLQLGGLLAGAVITEVVFAWPGMGSLMVDAIHQRDYPVVQGVVLVMALGYVLANRAADLLVDPTNPTAFQTLQAALDAAAPGDRILVRGPLFAPISYVRKSVTIER